MAFNYAEILAVADSLIAEFGRGMSLRRKVGADTVTRACVGVEVDYSATERDGSNIQFTDRRFLIRAGDLAIGPDAEEDKLVLDGKELRVVTVKRIQPASLNLVWDLQVRL